MTPNIQTRNVLELEDYRVPGISGPFLLKKNRKMYGALLLYVLVCPAKGRFSAQKQTKGLGKPSGPTSGMHKNMPYFAEFPWLEAFSYSVARAKFFVSKSQAKTTINKKNT